MMATVPDKSGNGTTVAETHYKSKLEQIAENTTPAG